MIMASVMKELTTKEGQDENSVIETKQLSENLIYGKKRFSVRR